jgi:GxxExxY protein
LTNNKISFEKQKIFPVSYDNQNIGEYRADIVIDNKIILELKSVKELLPVMEAQLINYLKISKLKVGYLINFNSSSLTYKRYINATECFNKSKASCKKKGPGHLPELLWRRDHASGLACLNGSFKRT